MTPPVLAWGMSLLGAALFFAAGTLFGLRRRAAPAVLAEARDSDPSGVHRRPEQAMESNPSEHARHEVKRLVEDLSVGSQGERALRPGSVLRAILSEETRGGEFAGAVIADELGLVVASTGEYGDALAAYGAFLASVGKKTSDALPLHDLRTVIVQDENDITLTVRPIATAEDNFALVTLAMRQQQRPLRVSTAPGR